MMKSDKNKNGFIQFQDARLMCLPIGQSEISTMMEADKNKNGFIQFQDARLMCLPGSSYIELSKPQGSSFCCCYCEKKSNHEHNIIGKVKFDPRRKVFLVSLVPKPGDEPQPSKPVETKSNLEIFPAINQKSSTDHDKPVDTIQKPDMSKAVTLYPTVCKNESEVASSFCKKLTEFSNSKGDTSLMYSAKDLENNSIHVIKAMKRPSQDVDSRSLLKSPVNKPVAECSTCLSGKSIPTLSEVRKHFEQEPHKFNIILKSIKNTEKVAQPDVPKIQDYPLKCEHCGQGFDNHDQLLSHSNEVHAPKGEVKYQCQICLQKLKSLQLYRKHKAEHLVESSKVRKHGCMLCQKRFLKPQHLNDHISRHFGAKPFTCNLCDKKYTSLFSLKSHKTNSHGIGEKPSCSFCDKTFFNQTYLNRHILQRHKRDPRLECQFCGHQYLRKDNLEAHIQAVHGESAGGGVAQCQLCAKSFGTRATLADHMRICHGILPWNKLPVGQNGNDLDVEKLERELAGSVQCKFCEQTFLPTEMESHLRFSHGVMPVRPGAPTERSIMEAAEALLRTLTPQPDYLLRCLTPLPMETLDEIIMDSALTKD